MRFKKTAIGLVLAGVTATGGGVVAADRAIDPYTDKGTHYELPIVSDIPQGERVEIAKDKAELSLIGWNDEYNIRIRPQIPTSKLGATKRDFTAPAKRPLLSKRMEFKSGDVTAFVEPKEGTDNEFDIDFTLDSKPDTNVFTYQIEGAEDFDFFYQPELTQEEIAQGDERSDNAVGSYAVYSKTEANHRVGDTNYATGKIAHIYRPKAIDANGAEVWAELSYTDGVLSVTVPQKFLDEAVYPVKVDPTFGYTAAGASFAQTCAQASDASQTTGRTYPLFAAGTLTSLHASLFVTAGTEAVDTYAALYREDSAGAGSHDLVAGIERLDLSLDTTKPFYTYTASSETLVADEYILALLCNGEDIAGAGVSVRISTDSGATYRNIYSENTTGAGSYATRRDENPWTEGAALSANIYSLYATYAATPGSQVTEEFVRSQSWTAPTAITSAKVACWGGGGSGFDDDTGTNGGAGGGGGAFASSTVALTPGNNYAVTVATTTYTTVGGKFSSFVADDKTVLACGGTSATSATANGVGGTTACSIGDVESAGGAGADAVTTDDTGGGGGGAGGPAGTGGAAANGQAATGGGGGGGNTGAASGVNGGTAVSPGGNGGAGVTTTYSAGTSDGKNGSYGGGGGGGGDNGTNGGDGGFPGGGSGGGEAGPGWVYGGAGGLCTVTYTAAAASPAPPPLQNIIFFD